MTAPITRDESTGPVVETTPAEGGTKHSHPGERQYIGIAVILAAITAVEVAISYIDSLKDVRPFILIFLSIIKFALVVLWFMHLRFDSRTYSRFFMMGLAGAVTLFLIVLMTFRVFQR